MDSAGFPPVEEVEELSQELLRELSSGCTEELLRRGLECRQRLDQRLLEAQSRARGLARGEPPRQGESPAPPRRRYVAQLYYEISRIDWDYGAEPGRIRGVHHGPDIAVPLDLEASRHSGTFVCDYLWGLVPAQWGPRRAPPDPSPN
ncbi:hypothetical protein DUI87_33535 [Hirundo rustica rustica]|uniref:Kinetochore protein Spc24 n=1 Tax=Hirundo rustica rustica TaxID=333673 RepID=A0A3M0IQG6_HIRRU|nr:hypothetical protein DUI87_33535 [Hirundo rustica rustica]